MVHLRPGNDRVAAVFCPAWANSPPIGLAYLKGAVKHRPVRSFDFNHQFFQDMHGSGLLVMLGDYPT